MDSQHPDVIAIQKLVERMKFGSLEVEQVDSWAAVILGQTKPNQTKLEVEQVDSWAAVILGSS